MNFRIVSTLCICLLLAAATNAQQRPPKKNEFLQFTAVAGSSEGTASASYTYNWRIGAKRKLEAGLGLRLTSYIGTKKEFYTAPAKLARSTTTPFIIVFAGHEEKNIDTLTVQRPFTTSLNLTFNAGYHLSTKWYAGFNIDLIGATIGRNSSAILHSNGYTTTESKAKPSAFNVLLTGDNDYGSLNSEFYVSYKIAEKWSIKAVYQFYFTEYKTTTIQQIAPDGTSVDRFRNKANLFGLGVTYHL